MRVAGLFQEVLCFPEGVFPIARMYILEIVEVLRKNCYTPQVWQVVAVLEHPVLL